MPAAPNEHGFFELGPLRHKLIALSNTSPQRFGLFIWDPHFRKKPTGVKLGKHGSIDLVRPYLSPGNRSDLKWIGNDYTSYEWHQQPNDNPGIPGCFQNNLVAALKRLAEGDDSSMLKLDATSMLDRSIFEYRDFSKGTMDIETPSTPAYLPSGSGRSLAAARLSADCNKIQTDFLAHRRGGVHGDNEVQISTSALLLFNVFMASSSTNSTFSAELTTFCGPVVTDSQRPSI